MILRRNSFSIIERRGFSLSYDIGKPAASGGYLNLSGFENDQFLVPKNHIYVQKFVDFIRD